MGPRPADLADELEAADPRAEIDTELSEVEDVDLSGALTPGSEMTPEERDRAFTLMITEIMDRGRGAAVRVTFAELVDRWFEIPGMTLAQRPALQRRITRLVELGAAERTSHGVYTLAPEILAILASSGPDPDELPESVEVSYDVEAELEITDGDDDQD